MSDSSATTRSHGPGPFITQRIQTRPEGGLLVAISRLHRKGHPARGAASHEEIQNIPATHAAAFRHLFFPAKLGWWIALSFAIGSTHFLIGALAANWPAAFPALLQEGEVVGWVFFTGSIFFTMAAWLQWLEALNRDVANALGGAVHHWCWFGWRPRNLGYLACLVQLVGTILFNFNTADAMITGLSWRQQDVLIWLPNMLGSICFLIASYLAYTEVSHGAFSFAPRSVSWWITIINLAGSVAFQVSALESVVGPAGISPHLLFWSTLWTAVGAVCFLVGAYLLIPELAEAGSSDD
ncbi:MAG: hypothetical protein ABJ308_03135 [Halieaceae bacterium]